MSKKILFLGDSLVEGYGVSKEASWVFLVDKKLDEYSCVNEGANGMLSGQVRDALEKSLNKELYDYYVILCGANDFIHGLSIDEVVDNIKFMIELIEENKRKAILILPPIPCFEEEFPFVNLNTMKSLTLKIQKLNHIYKEKALILSNHLEKESYFFDGLHPTEEGHRIIAKSFIDYGLSKNFWKN